jgi:hydroxymethylglutaryl-CoA lyase
MKSIIPSSAVKIVECPRDAMQGWPHIIPTQQKIKYLNSLLKTGFHTIDFGSFVSPKWVPQMADTKDVVPKLQLQNNGSSLLAIVLNVRGAEEALQFDEIAYLGFPFSISPTFQLRNANSTIEESLQRIDAIQNVCSKRNKTLLIYLSMGFGNPYGDVYNEDILLHYAEMMVQRNIQIISLADTVGLATPPQISFALQTLIPAYSQVEFGVHLHSSVKNRKEKLEAAYVSGCRRFDGALKGIGGCPMAQDELVGNMDTAFMISYFENLSIDLQLDKNSLAENLQMVSEIFV